MFNTTLLTRSYRSPSSAIHIRRPEKQQVVEECGLHLSCCVAGTLCSTDWPHPAFASAYENRK